MEWRMVGTHPCTVRWLCRYTQLWERSWETGLITLRVTLCKSLFFSDYSDMKALRALSRHGAGSVLTEAADPAHFVLNDMY